MQNHFIQGTTMKVCGGSKEVHGFELDELVLVVDVRPEPELSDVALCKGADGHTAILIIDEAEDL